MKKVLLITNRLVTGGPSRHVAMLAKGLEQDYEVLVVGGSAAAGEEKAVELFSGLKNPPVLIPELNRKVSISRDFSTYRKLRNIIRDFQPDIVHTHTSKVGALGRRAAGKEGVKRIIHTFHGLLFEHYFNPAFSQMLMRLERRLAKNTDVLIALSGSQKKELTEKYRIASEHKVAVVSLGIEPDDFAPDAALRAAFRREHFLDDNCIAIGIVGRLAAIKNVAFFIDGIAELQRQISLNIKAFVIGGGAEKEKLIKYARSKSLRTVLDKPGDADFNICFCGWANDLKFVYSGLDILALTSLAEGTPMSLMEAQLAAKPIVAARVGGVADVTDKQTTLLFEKGDLRAFVENLQKLASSPQVRKIMGERAMAFAREKFSKARMLQEIKDLYEK